MSLRFGILIIFTLSGSEDSGIYFTSLLILTTALALSTNVNSILHPSISGISEENQAKFTERALYLTLLITMPIISILYFESENLLSVFGDKYTQNTLALSILSINIPFIIFTTSIYHFLHVRGNYKQVFLIGFVQSSISIILYFILIESLSSLGAAIAFTSGTVTGTFVSYLFARENNLELKLKRYFIISIIPISLSGILFINDIPIYFSYPIIIILSIIIFIKLKLFTDDELSLVIYAIVTKSKGEKLYQKLSNIMKKIK
jgi:O-antigen/teichoic acid export membrane protein